MPFNLIRLWVAKALRPRALESAVFEEDYVMLSDEELRAHRTFVDKYLRDQTNFGPYRMLQVLFGPEIAYNLMERVEVVAPPETETRREMASQLDRQVENEANGKKRKRT